MFIRTISKEQFCKLKEAYNYCSDKKEFHKLLQEYTGIIAKPYTAFNYYDDTNNYIGNSDDASLDELLDCACVFVD